jgi:hypothetical protein
VQSPSPPWPDSIRAINDLPQEQKRAIYRTLIPDWVFAQFDIDPDTLTVDGQPVIHFRCPAGSSAVEIMVYHRPDAEDPALYLQMADSFHNQLIVLMATVNDPESPRFNIDRDEHGQPTQLGTIRRNIPEEIRAMNAGLAPGQIRRGLRIFRTGIPTFELFLKRMGHSMFFIEPLFYHNAIIFERYGFAYSRGLRLMQWIHAEFQPGGELHARLTGDSPFRMPDAWRTISGRSWAIHDGILGRPFTDVQMYKRIGERACVETFPGAVWSLAASGE